ncbi:terminase gpA endonuclease subunit [Verrucomicrobium spinosum]|uniref:terminase gpA endonuclease subunit n=1 Tax=Verrucomicrobium spinosum TaxID=2736 RepID=UPI00017465DC|nr:terminase gpA endonuclease subunit [Verrucomicrobium spinosum]
MSATPKQYDVSNTPWTKEWQELPLRSDVRVGAYMKSSRTGVTEGALNILRWMPENWPGNALYSITSDKKAREIVDRRMLTTMSAGVLSADPKDTGLSRISLDSMDMVFSGSGSADPFQEIWYRLIILDEIENHVKNQETTTYKRARSRQTDVPDGLVLAIAKPELAGGIIDEIFISGTQKKFLIPCPRCERLIELRTDHLVVEGCYEGGEWDLARVVTETYYQCQLCHGRIEEKEKRSMVNSDLARQVPTPPSERRRSPSGKYVPPEPGVESYHISDLYSLHERVSWGELKQMHLLAHVINPTQEAKKYFRINHEGWPWEDEVYSVTAESVKALKAGRVEDVKVSNADGTETIIKTTLAPLCLLTDHNGDPRNPVFYMAYKDGKPQGRLPFKPVWITMTADKQFSYLKYTVFGWLPDGQAFWIDRGTVQDEDQLDATLRLRPYFIEGEEEPMFITAGLIDSGHRPHEVYRFCLKMINLHGWMILPARGEGEHEGYKGKTWRLVKDYVDGTPIMVRYFFDHGIKNEFYLSHVQKRAEPRLWLPHDLPETSIAELTAERYSEEEKKWIHEKSKYGPNDEGDGCKMQYVLFHENRDALRALGR